MRDESLEKPPRALDRPGIPLSQASMNGLISHAHTVP
jgi:hypothetical protein